MRLTMRSITSSSGFSLIEAIISVGVLTTGMLGAVGVLARGMSDVVSSPTDLIATQKATEAVESVFTARDTRVLTWAQIRNVKGVSGNDGGVFLDGPQPVRSAGPDGMVNTADDGAIESVVEPGKDNLVGTADDEVVTLNGFTREITIVDVEPSLRQITVTIKYQQGAKQRQYQLTTYVSNYV
jgi:hypothetical protein